jgi:hypothetical protein
METKTKLSKKITLAKKTAEEKGLFCSEHLIETIAVVEDAVMNIPGENDKFLTLIPEHEFAVAETKELKNLKILTVGDHYRRGDFYQGIMVTRNFYVPKELLGKKILAWVFIKIKINLSDGSKKILLDITPSLNPQDHPRNVLKVGTENALLLKRCGLIKENGKTWIRIPETNRFITIEPKEQTGKKISLAYQQRQ